MSAAEDTPPPVIADLAAKREAGETGAPRKRQQRSLLPSPAPAPNATRGELAGWITVALGLGEDPIEKAEAYGRHDDARIALELTSGRRITYERQADLFESKVLIRRVVIATGAQIAHYASADAQIIATAVLRMAETLVEDDSRSEACEWGRDFLKGAAMNRIEISEFATPAGRYEGLAALVEWRPSSILPPGTPAAERAALILDRATGTRLVRVSDLAAHVRGQVGRALSWGALHGRMVEVGWEHLREVEQRQPRGTDRKKCHLYAVPRGWETS
jgi:hypothetical protein